MFFRSSVVYMQRIAGEPIGDYSAIIPSRTRFYSKDSSGTVINSRFVDIGFKTPGDGWLSSAEDMAKFEVAMLNDGLVTRATRTLMWTPQKTSDGKQTPYGIGWAIDDDLPHTASHGGGEWGTSTFIMMAPEQRAGVVVLINLNGDHLASDLGPELMKIVLGVR